MTKILGITLLFPMKKKEIITNPITHGKSIWSLIPQLSGQKKQKSIWNHWLLQEKLVWKELLFFIISLFLIVWGHSGVIRLYAQSGFEDAQNDLIKEVIMELHIF